MEPLRRALQNGHRLAFGAHLDEMVLAEIRKAAVPYFSITGSGGIDDDSATGLVSLSETKAIVELAETSAAHGIRYALRVALDEADELFDIPFAARGIVTESMAICPDTSINRFENSSQFAYNRLLARLSDPGVPKVGLVYFADDSFTAAGLWAIEHAGLRVPDDIRVVSFSNRGNRPFYHHTLACVEHDLVDDADRIAKGMLAFLDGRKFPRLITCVARFLSGDTF